MKLQSIQVLRGMAALLVVFYHMNALEARSILQNGGVETPVLGGLISNGYAGVDLFFVISGFIMIYVTDTGRKGVGASLSFLFARITRIYPLWWFYAAIRAVYMLAIYGGAAVGPDGEHPISRSEPLFSYMVKSFLLIPQGEHPILGVGWTLVHEVYFYIVFAIIMLAPRKWWPVLFTIWGLAVVGGSFAGLSGSVATTLLSLATYPMTMEFILGAAAGMLVLSGRRWRPGLITLLATLALCGALFLQGAEDAFLLQWGRVLWFGVPCTLLVYGFASLDIADRLSWAVPTIAGGAVSIALFQLYGLTDESPATLTRSAAAVALSCGAITMAAIMWIGWLLGTQAPATLNRLTPALSSVWQRLARLGDWSYSLYLCHMIVLVGLIRSFEAIAGLTTETPLASFFNLAGPGLLANILFAASGAVLTVTASRYSYEYIEKPMIRTFSKLRRRLFPAHSAKPKPTEARAAIW